MAERENDPIKRDEYHKGKAKLVGDHVNDDDQLSSMADNRAGNDPKHKGKARSVNDEDDDHESAASMVLDSPSSKKRKSTDHLIQQDNIADLLLDFHIGLNDTNNPLRPGSRYLTHSDFFISKTLPVNDLLPLTSGLVVDPIEASLLADEPDFIDWPVQQSFEKTLLAFDEFDRQFELLLIPSGYGNFKLAGDWGVFVDVHKLKGGDEIKFYKIKDEKVSNERFYALRCFRKMKPIKRTKEGI